MCDVRWNLQRNEATTTKQAPAAQFDVFVVVVSYGLATCYLLPKQQTNASGHASRAFFKS
jgi:hypothetical protein